MNRSSFGLPALFTLIFAAAWWLPVGSDRFDGAVLEALHLVRWYAREHVLLCLIPAFFIAGAIAAFVRQGAILRYLGPSAPKPVAYGVASVSGSVLAVCSCTVLPLFAGISRMGAGLGPATAFLYAGPAVNVLAVILTGRVLGVEIGLARALGAVVFSIIIGLAMALIFRREEAEKAAVIADLPDETPVRPWWEDAAFFGAMIGVLVFANWGDGGSGVGLWRAVAAVKWWLSGGFFAIVVILASRRRNETGAWFGETWSFARQILPLLLAGVFVSGLLLGRPGHEGMIPSQRIAALVGGEGLGANLFASVAGSLMYFATLTEIPILEGLMGAGMGQGPALALLLAGPALSLPSMLVIRGVLGTRKTLVYVLLVVVTATISGLIYGRLV